MTFLLFFFALQTQVPQSFVKSLEYMKKGDFQGSDSLLTLSFFEADTFFKNDVLFLKEILWKYGSDPKISKILGDFYFSWYVLKKPLDVEYGQLSDSLGEVVKYLSLLGMLRKKPHWDEETWNTFWALKDTLLKFHSAFLIISTYRDEPKVQKEIANHLIKEYPFSPYLELLRGYIALIERKY